MPSFSYLDFDLQIERAPTGYRVVVTRSPAGNASADFALPFSDVEIENLVLKLGGARRRVRRIDSPEMESAKQFGGKLFNSVFVGDVRSVYTASLSEANARDVGLRLRLHLDNAPELVDLPWEYLYNPPLNRFLALSVRTPIVRFLELPEQIRPLLISPPLRILVMISSPTDYEPLDVEREWTRLKQSLGDLAARGIVTLDRLEPATLGELQRKLQERQYHVFHFVGHGGFEERRQDGVLIMENEQGRGRRVSAQTLGTILHDQDSLRLAILNACEGARAARNDPFAGVAQSLVQQGIPAVIAMQFEISDDAAATFASGFYQALAHGYPVDAALAEVRKTIFASDNEIEWGTPVLYLRAPDGQIFDVREQPAPVSAPVHTPVTPQVETPRPAFSPEAPSPKAAAPPPVAPAAAAFPKKYGLPIAIAAVLALLLLGGIYGFGILPLPFGSETPTSPSETVVAEAPTDPSETVVAEGPTEESNETPESVTIESRGADGAEMVLVPAGEFLMGSSDDEVFAAAHQKPPRTFYLDEFWIDLYEVTNAQYAKCVSAGSCQPPSSRISATRSEYYGRSEFQYYPVINVSWNDAHTYCEWAEKHLPTEAQWEKAARGTDGRLYPWGNDFDSSLVNSAESQLGDTAEVTDYYDGASPYSVLNMAGNVWEWVNDLYDPSYFANAPESNPEGPSDGVTRVLRGGSWSDPEGNVRVAAFNDYDPEQGNLEIGFRCAQ